MEVTMAFRVEGLGSLTIETLWKLRSIIVWGGQGALPILL